MKIKKIMRRAHKIRENAAKKFNCPASEIIFSECLKMAWEQAKKKEEENNPKNENRFLHVKFNAKDKQDFFAILNSVKKYKAENGRRLFDFDSRNKAWFGYVTYDQENEIRSEIKRLVAKNNGQVEFNRTWNFS